MGSPCWGAPQQGLMAPNSSKFPDIRLQYPDRMVENGGIGLAEMFYKSLMEKTHD